VRDGLEVKDDVLDAAIASRELARAPRRDQATCLAMAIDCG
jgi:hypothetical protein